jgi:hypothetical protein
VPCAVAPHMPRPPRLDGVAVGSHADVVRLAIRRSFTLFVSPPWRDQPRATADVAARFADIPHLHAEDPADHARLQALDFALAFGRGSFTSLLPRGHRYGSWSIQHETAGEELPFFQEVTEGEDVTYAALVAHGVPGKDSHVLEQGWFRTEKRSYAQELHHVLSSIAEWPARVCRRIAERSDGVEITPGLAHIPARTAAGAIVRGSFALALESRAADPLRSRAGVPPSTVERRHPAHAGQRAPFLNSVSNLEPHAPVIELEHAAPGKRLVGEERVVAIGRGESSADQRICQAMLGGSEWRKRSIDISLIDRGRSDPSRPALQLWRPDRTPIFVVQADVGIPEVPDEARIRIAAAMREREEEGYAGGDTSRVRQLRQAREQTASPVIGVCRGVHDLRRNLHAIAEPNGPRQHAARGDGFAAVGERRVGDSGDTGELARVFAAQPIEREIAASKRRPQQRDERRQIGSAQRSEPIASATNDDRLFGLAHGERC